MNHDQPWEYQITLGCGEIIRGRVIKSDEERLVMLTDSEKFNIVSIARDNFPGNWVKL